MIKQMYTCGDGKPIQLTKVCHHNWAGSPDGDKCCADNEGHCAWVADNEMVVCYHTDFKEPCPIVPSPCGIDGSTCIVLDKRQSVLDRERRVQLGYDKNRIYNGNSQKDDEAPGIVNPPFNFSDWSTTALVIMDMWNTHRYPDSKARVEELAGPINQFASILREKGALIVHSPSSSDALSHPVSDYYRGDYAAEKPSEAEYKARKRGQDARLLDDPIHPGESEYSTRVRQNFYYIDDQSVWNAFNTIVPVEDMSKAGPEPYKQHPSIQVHENDVIIADGLDYGEGSNIAYQQLLGCTANRPNLIYCGVHTNQCILRCHNGMRTMYRAGKSLWIVKDLTDCVSTPNAGDKHFAYTDDVINWIGRHLLASSKTSEEVGMPRFRFQGDNRSG
jgi:nicotinamidase-related amidase